MAEAPWKSVAPGFEPGHWSLFPYRHSSEQCLQNHYRALATSAYTELPTSMVRQRQLASSTTGLRVHATCWSPAEPTATTSNSTSLKAYVSSGHCITAHLRLVQVRWGMKDSRLGPMACGWHSAKECRSWVQVRSLVLFPVAILLSSVSRIITEHVGIVLTCSTLLLFPYPVPTDIHGSVQHVTLWNVPVDVLPRLFSWFDQVKHLECHHILPPREVQCVHMYSVAWNALVFCTNHYLTLFWLWPVIPNSPSPPKLGPLGAKQQPNWFPQEPIWLLKLDPLVYFGSPFQ